LADVLDDPGRQVVEKLGAAAYFQHLDVTNAEQWEQVVEASVSRFGRLDTLVNNAGIVKMGPCAGRRWPIGSK